MTKYRVYFASGTGLDSTVYEADLIAVDDNGTLYLTNAAQNVWVLVTPEGVWQAVEKVEG